MDDVVQPYTLPRNLHAIVEHASMGRSALGELKKGADVASNDEEVKEEAGVDADEQGQEPFTLLNDEPEAVGSGEDDDEMMEEVIVDRQPVGAPKTMQELAEEAARHDASKNQPVDTEEELVLAAPPPPAEEKKAANGRSTRASRSATKSGTATPRASTRGKSKASAASKVTPRRTRKRTRSQAEESDSGLEGVEVEDAEPSPAKRSRARAPPPAVTPSTRVLRTRKPKDASKVQEEMDMEAAYRAAIAE